MKSHEALIEILAIMDSKKEIEAFLFDLLSQEERKECSRRLDVAHRLHAGESYKHIEDETGMSSTTIARISKFLHGEK